MNRRARPGIDEGDRDVAHAKSPPTHDEIAALVLRRSKLTPAEESLLRRVFPGILAAHDRRVWNHLRRRGIQECDAEDLEQEAFVALFVFIQENGFPDDVPAMLCSLAEGKVRNHVRGKARAPESVALPSSGSEKPPSDKEMERVLDLRELPEQLLPRLSPEHRELVERVILQDLSVDVVAEELGLPLGTVKSRLMAAKRELVTLAERFLPPSQRDS